MGKRSFSMSMSSSPLNKRTMNYVKQLRERFTAISRQMPYSAAEDILKGIKAKIPATDEYKSYRDSLKISEMKTGKDGHGFAIHADMKARRVKKIEVKKTILFVRGKRVLDRIPPEITLLEDFGPWTTETIPFWPKPSQAVVIQRIVSEKQAAGVTKKQKDQQKKVNFELAKIGSNQRAGNMQKIIGLTGQGKAVPDVAFTAMSLEFGGGGRGAVPVWRKTLAKYNGEGFKNAFVAHKQMLNTFTNPNFSAYKSWPPKMKFIKAEEVKAGSEFAKKLGY